jgi:hypothetical protein
MFWRRSKNENGLRIIYTARSKWAINRAINKGFIPLIKKVEPSKKIQSKFAIIRNTITGKIDVISDFRQSDRPDYEIVLDWTLYYPHYFKSPFAAYLIPNDIKIGERVYINDLIEDVVGGSWNQGDTYRLSSSEAIWDGTELLIQFDSKMSFNIVG